MSLKVTMSASTQAPNATNNMCVEVEEEVNTTAELDRFLADWDKIKAKIKEE